MKEVKFKEVKSTGVIEKKVNFNELYELFKDKIDGFDLTPHGFLVMLSEKILKSPTLVLRFHFIDEEKKMAILATIRCTEVAEKLKALREEVAVSCKPGGI